MKKYNYYGNSTLAFTHKVGDAEKDFVVSGTGPHELPSDAEIVKTHIGLSTLVEVKGEKADKPKKD